LFSRGSLILIKESEIPLVEHLEELAPGNGLQRLRSREARKIDTQDTGSLFVFGGAANGGWMAAT